MAPSLDATVPAVPLLFDRSLVKARRQRAAKTYSQYGFLKERVAHDLTHRFTFINRSFEQGLDLGGHTGQMVTAFTDKVPLISTDLSEAMVTQSPARLKVVLDEEKLPFAAHSLDLVVSVLSLHWVNDLPGTFVQIYRCLKSNGLFMASLFGEETLKELRDCLLLAELELYGGAAPRVSPLITVKEAGALLQRAGFDMPVADCERVQVTYPHPLALLHDLRRMGETNALFNRPKTLMPRRLLKRVIALYQERYGLGGGRIPATFNVVTVTGWAV